MDSRRGRGAVVAIVAVMGLVSLLVPGSGVAAVQGHFCGAGVTEGRLRLSVLCQEMPPFPIGDFRNIGIGLVVTPGPETEPSVVSIGCTLVKSVPTTNNPGPFPATNIYASGKVQGGSGHYLIRIADGGFNPLGGALRLDFLGVKRVSTKPANDGLCGLRTISVPTKPVVVGDFYSRTT